jgi:hypothetical protein
LAVLAVFAAPTIALADDGPFKGRTKAAGANCQKNSYFDIEATIVGDKVRGTIQGDQFRGPVKFSGDATETTFTANHTFVNLNNLKVVISGKRVDAETFTLTTVWNGGGPSNCQSEGPGKKA